MAAALLTAIGVSVAALGAALVLGYTAASSADLFQHVNFAIFATLLVLLSHSLTMFYLIGKGRAIREAVDEGGLSAEFVTEVARLRRPVFSLGSLAMALTMATAIIGGGVDTGVIPPAIHSLLGLAAVAANLATLRAEYQALAASTRIAGEVNRLLGAS